MARNRSSRNRRRNRRGGMLVRESAIQRGVGSSGLYSIPVHITELQEGGKIVLVKKTTGSVQVTVHYFLEVRRNDDTTIYSHEVHLSGGSDPSTPTVIRISSMTVGSVSPFYVDVRTPAANVLYQIPGQKVTKIVPSRENSIMGNPALFLDAVRNASSTPTVLAEIDGCDSGVDVTIYLVVGSLL